MREKTVCCFTGGALTLKLAPLKPQNNRFHKNAPE